MNRLNRLIGMPGMFPALVVVIAGAVLASVRPGAEPAAAPQAAASSRAPLVRAVASVGITVSDLARSVEFYTTVLGFEKTDEAEAAGDAAEHLTGVFGATCRVARLRLGDERLDLTEFLAPQGKPLPQDSRSNDRWFQHIALAVSDMDRAYAHLRAHHVRHASSGPQTLPSWNPAAGGISAFYFMDPDDHVLEIIHFPPGKGDPKWHDRTDKLILGIDHTAIVVADTDRSLAFYRDTLGLTVAGASENYGSEQEHLNNVFGARLRITTLRGQSGPGVELLEYLAPSNGREYPADARACDLVHWQTVVSVTDAESAAELLRHAGGRWVSPGSVDGVDALAGAPRAALVRDPDGHALLLAQSNTPPTPRVASPPTTEHAGRAARDAQ